MSKITVNATFATTSGIYNIYNVSAVSGTSLPSWVTSQLSGGSLPSQGLYVSWSGSTTNALSFINNYTNSTTFKIAYSGTQFSNLSATNITVSQLWNAGQYHSIAKHSPNNPPISGMLSLSPGPWGGDGGNGIDLTNAGSNLTELWVFNDTYCATSGNSTRVNPSSRFIRNCIAVQSGSASNDLSLNSFTYYFGGTAANPTSFINPTSDYNGWASHYWLNGGGFCINPTSTYIFALPRASAITSTSGTFQAEHGYRTEVFWVNNVTADPNTWNFSGINWPWGQSGNGGMSPSLGSQFIDLGDGYITGTMSIGTGFGVGLFRTPKSDLDATLINLPTFMRTEFYMGPNLGWIKANALQNSTDLGQIPSVVPPIYEGFGFFSSDITGSFVKLTDRTVLFEMGTLAPAGSNPCLNYRASTSLSGTWGSQVPLYSPNTINNGKTPGGSTLWTYMAYAHPTQTWTGQSTNDVLLTFSTNITSGSTTGDTSSYWVDVLRITGL